MIKPPATVHLMGICGTAMASLAGLLQEQGFTVTGSDANCYPPMSDVLKNLGVQVCEGYKKENLIPAPDFVIVGNVIMKKYEEAQYLLQSDIPYTSLPKALGEYVIKDCDSFVMTGTHGKTTTTALMAYISDLAGFDAGFLVGGVPKNYGVSFRRANSKMFIVEGDEYDTAFFDKVPKFIHYKPRYVTLTSIEFDHADIYSSIDDVKSAFLKLMSVISKKGHLLALAGHSLIDEVVEQCVAPVYRYGVEQGDYQAYDIRPNHQGTQFRLKGISGQSLGEFFVPLSGQHNVLNTVSVLAHAHLLGWDLDKIRKGLCNFKGIKRRQEVLGVPNGIRVIEDFAHHPTAVATTLSGLRSQYPQGRMIAIFEPRSATSRRRIFQSQYAKAFSEADHIYIARPIRDDRIPDSERFSSEQLVSELRDQGRQAHVFGAVEEVVALVKNLARPGDSVCIMSNGGFDGIYHKLLRALEPDQDPVPH